MYFKVTHVFQSLESFYKSLLDAFLAQNWSPSLNRISFYTSNSSTDDQERLE